MFNPHRRCLFNTQAYHVAWNQQCNCNLHMLACMHAASSVGTVYDSQMLLSHSHNPCTGSQLWPETAATPLDGHSTLKFLMYGSYWLAVLCFLNPFSKAACFCLSSFDQAL